MLAIRWRLYFTIVSHVSYVYALDFVFGIKLFTHLLTYLFTVECKNWNMKIKGPEDGEAEWRRDFVPLQRFSEGAYGDHYRATLCIARPYIVIVNLDCATRFDLQSWFLHIWQPNDSSFLVPNFLSIFQRHDLQIQSQIQNGVDKNVVFSFKTSCISETVSNTAKVTIGH